MDVLSEESCHSTPLQFTSFSMQFSCQYIRIFQKNKKPLAIGTFSSVILDEKEMPLSNMPNFRHPAILVFS